MFRFTFAILPVLFFVFQIYSQDQKAKYCSSLKDCVKKSEATTIHRKKINFYTDALENFTSKVSDNDRAILLLSRAKSIILEANGDSGYRGEIDLKVTHKPEYKKAQLDKAKLDLDQVEKVLDKINENLRKEYSDLRSKLEST